MSISGQYYGKCVSCKKTDLREKNFTGKFYCTSHKHYNSYDESARGCREYEEYHSEREIDEARKKL